MSGLEKFEASDSWRKNVKKFLFIERKPTLKKPTTTSETARYSLDIGKDLQKLLKDRKKQADIEKERCSGNQKGTSGVGIKDKMSHSAPHCDDTLNGRSEQNFTILEKVSDESFEALERMCEKTVSDPDSTLFRYLNQEEGKQKYIDSPWRRADDESFEALERMCDKTASDPNSTLFQYLHSDNKDQVLADAKKRSTDGNCAKIEFESRDPLSAKFGDCTLLDDVEAPSRLWENTIAADAGFRTSPIKMVGLMRPSTIIEEAADETTNSDISSQVSFQTASTKGLLSDISSAYDTAHESTVTSAHTDLSDQRNEEVEIDVDELLMLAIDKSRNKLLSSQMSYTPPRVEISEADISKTNIGPDKENKNKSDGNETSEDLIDLENTVGTLESSPHSSVFGGDTMVDVVVIDDDQVEFSDEAKPEADGDEEDMISDEEEDIADERTDIKLEYNSNEYSLRNEVYYEDKENYTFDTSSERSIKFNDTMEEVEYLLKKGREYMAAKEVIVENNTENKMSPVNDGKMCKTQPNSPLVTARKEILTTNSASKAKLPSSATFIKTPNTNIQMPSTDRYALDMRPFPKLDIFGRSQRAGHPRQKVLSNKNQFAHVVSPIGTYMKKTASTPLMSTGKMKNNANILNATAFRELEYESRLCQPKTATNSSVFDSQNCPQLATLPGCSGVQKTLPKKAYISSELKHIVDERTPFTIPGGKKIQKYLENAMMPAVLRHDGKMKIPGAMGTSQATVKYTSSEVKSSVIESASTTSHRNNASLADLSVMSGDVSMYTIMDAQKF